MKQVIIIRNDLKMGKGKIAAQCCHASLGSYKNTDSKIIKKWEDEGQAKIILKVNSLEELFELKEMAKKNNLSNCLVTDAGRTQLPSSTITCFGIGPGEDKIIDKITDGLKLL